MAEREDGYYWVRMQGADAPEIAIWRRGKWWFTATHLPVLPHDVRVLSGRSLSPDDSNL